MIKTIISVGLWAAAGWLIGLWLGAETGWAVLCLVLLIMILDSGLHLSRISQ